MFRKSTLPQNDTIQASILFLGTKYRTFYFQVLFLTPTLSVCEHVCMSVYVSVCVCICVCEDARRGKKYWITWELEL